MLLVAAFQTKKRTYRQITLPVCTRYRQLRLQTPCCDATEYSWMFPLKKLPTSPQNLHSPRDPCFLVFQHRLHPISFAAERTPTLLILTGPCSKVTCSRPTLDIYRPLEGNVYPSSTITSSSSSSSSSSSAILITAIMPAPEFPHVRYSIYGKNVHELLLVINQELEGNVHAPLVPCFLPPHPPPHSSLPFNTVQSDLHLYPGSHIPSCPLASSRYPKGNCLWVKSVIG